MASLMADTSDVAGPAPIDEPNDESTEMQLVLAIVQDEDAGPVIEALTSAGFRATRINTVGGFLRKGNATVVVGVEKARLHRALLIIRDNCETRTEFFVPTAPGEVGEPYPLDPIQVQVGGATVFVLDVERFERL
jgi:uncharacterized protein YaaQ